MKVKELIEKLKNQDEDLRVWVTVNGINADLKEVKIYTAHFTETKYLILDDGKVGEE
jgi:hypothetical protein